MKILHVVPGLENPFNGIAVAAKLIAREQRKAGHEVGLVETREFVAPEADDAGSVSFVSSRDEIWVHSMWLPMTMKACRRVLEAGVPLVRMTHANLDPLRMRSKGWKKLPVWYLFERRLMNRSARVVATCAAEAEWNRRAGVSVPIEVYDLASCFDLNRAGEKSEGGAHVLFLGRRQDPLKGVRFLEGVQKSENRSRSTAEGGSLDVHYVSDKTGEELEKEWAWCDVLCLPTLSENFGLVIAEALERGKRVITTDGAPAWEEFFAAHPDRGIYIKGFRMGTDDFRVSSLKDALRRI